MFRMFAGAESIQYYDDYLARCCSGATTESRRKPARFICKIQDSSPVTIKLVKYGRHVPSSTPLAPCSICRYAKRASCSIWPCIKYASGRMHIMFNLHTQHSVGSSSTPPVLYGSSSTSSPNSPSSRASVAENQAQLPSLARPTPRIQVASLLADPQTRSYHLEIVQQPQKTAEFGHSNLSRLPVTPPIIAQLTVRDPSGNSVVPEAELPFLIVHLSLFSEDGRVPLNMGSEIGCGNTPPLLYGNLVSSVNQLEDPQGNLGLYFLFPDVSIRWRGRYQLGMTLTRISGFDPIGTVCLASQGTVLAEAKTRTFEVFTLNQYTAVPPTRLTQCFLRQGARMFTYMPLTS